MNQDPLGRQAAPVSQDRDHKVEVWAKDMEDGSKVVGLFNRNETLQNVAANWSDLGLRGKKTVRDLWRQKDLGVFAERFETTVPAHGVVLIRVISSGKSATAKREDMLKIDLASGGGFVGRFMKP